MKIVVIVLIEILNCNKLFKANVIIKTFARRYMYVFFEYLGRDIFVCFAEISDFMNY